MLIILFDYQGAVHKEFVPEGKTVNVEFYKAAMDRLLKCIHRVHPAAFCCRDFFLLHNNAPAHKAASVCQFLTPPPKKKNFTTFYHPPYYPDYFLSPKLKTKLKGLHFADVAEIQESVTEELKKVQKEEFSAALQKLYDRANPVYMQMELILNIKKARVFLTCLRFKKKVSRTFVPHCVYCNI